MEEYRCKTCNKLLFKGSFKGLIEIKCNRCGKIQPIAVITETKNNNADNVEVLINKEVCNNVR